MPVTAVLAFPSDAAHSPAWWDDAILAAGGSLPTGYQVRRHWRCSRSATFKECSLTKWGPEQHDASVPHQLPPPPPPTPTPWLAQAMFAPLRLLYAIVGPAGMEFIQRHVIDAVVGWGEAGQVHSMVTLPMLAAAPAIALGLGFWLLKKH